MMNNKVVHIQTTKYASNYIYKDTEFVVNILLCLICCNSLLMFSDSDVHMTWDGISKLKVVVPPTMRESLIGLCGNFDGDASNE